MKIWMITRHAVSNYGSLLQTIALQKIINSMDENYECKVIDYIREDEHYKNLEKTLLKSKPQWNRNPFKKAIYLLIRQPESMFAGMHFENMRNKYLRLTKRYISEEELQIDDENVDIYVAGSDQVWGPVATGEYDSCYCLSFTNRGKKISYAASFGKTKLTDEQKEVFKKYLGQYQHLSVREDSAVELLKEWGIEAKQVLDPTLLMDETMWRTFFVPIKKKNYILVYQLHRNENMDRYIKKVARETEYSIVRISASYHQVIRGGEFVYLPALGEFLSYIKNAKCMITDSFHGTAFAINFNTSFIEILPQNHTDGRNISILKMTGLESRILKDYDDLTLVDRKIDFSVANEILRRERAKSLEILRMMLEE